ncbi:CopG family transcriptional regulator [Clostridia bacterium]|nr:CopG family transcriptional regulator [Clostridia bacterium]
MSKNIIFDDKYYTDAPGDVDAAFERAVEISADFLPSPEELAKASVKKTVTIRLDSSNLDFFKRVAAKNGTQYQTMINNLLSEYVRQHRSAV